MEVARITMNEELRIKITAQIADAQKNLKDIQSQLDKLGTDGEKSASKLGAAFGKMGDATKKALGVAAKATAAATAAAAAGVVALTKSAVESYAEYEQLVGGIDTLFKDSSQKVQQYAQDAFKTAGMGANDYMALVTSFSASLLQSVGGDTEQAAEAANQAIIDMADNANKMGTSMESIQNAYQGFAKQNYTMLDNLKLGYGGTKEEMQRLLEDAQKISGIEYDISNLNDVYSAIHVIQTELGITGTTAKEASSTIQGSAAAMKGAWSNLVTGLADENADFDKLLDNFIESVGTFGENLIPRIEVALSGVVNLISGLAPKIVAVIPKLVNTLLPKLIKAATDIVTALAQALPELLGAIVAVIPDLINGIITALGAIIDTLPTIIQAICDALPVLLPTLIDGIVTLLVMLCESFMDIIQPIIDALPTIIISLVEAIMSNLPLLIEGIITLILGIVEAIPEIIQALIDSLPTIISMLIEGLLGCLPQLIMGLIQLVIAITLSLPQILLSLIEGIINIFVGVWDGICNVFSAVGEWFGDNFGAAWDAVKGIFSAIGGWFADRWQDIKNVFSAIGEWFGDIFGGAWDAIKNAFSAVGNFFTGIWDKIKSIFGKVGSAIADAVSGAFKNAVNWVLEKAIGIINGFITAINFAISIINLIPGVEISKLKKLEVPKLAKGGVVDGATIAMIGEQGKEAVVPLENNLEWLDKMATMLVERMGGGNKPIILEVDGQVFAKTAISTINQNTEQTGRLALNIM